MSLFQKKNGHKKKRGSEHVRLFLVCLVCFTKIVDFIFEPIQNVFLFYFWSILSVSCTLIDTFLLTKKCMKQNYQCQFIIDVTNNHEQL